MSTNLPSKIESSVFKISPNQVEILRKTLFKGFSDDEIQFSLAVCTRTGLDPFSRQIHFSKRKSRKGDEDTIVMVTGIDGLRLIADRSEAYAGSDEPTFKLNEERKPIEAKVSVYKIVQGVRCAFTASVRWIEFYPGDGPEGFMWRKMPFGQLGKCAEAQALRKAFPAETSNLCFREEAQPSNEASADIEIEPKHDADFLTTAAKREPDLGDYVIPIGIKYKGKRLSELSPGVLSGFLNWVKENIEHKNPETIEFITNAELFLEGA